MAEKKMQIVLASAEVAPFVKTGGLGDVAGSLPRALVEAGAEVIVMVPKYGSIAEEYKSRMEHLCDFYVSLGWRNEYCGLERLDQDGVIYLFVDNEHYFNRSYPYGFFDDGERFAFFSKAICESLQHLPEGFTCDVLHCNDWHTALAPVFLREFYQGLPLYERVKTVFSIHNIAFQGQYSDTILNDILGLAHIPAAASQLRCDDRSINFMMGALHYADTITTVSPTYAQEIQTPEYGEGLDGILRDRSISLQGILNGIDTDAWNPATDPMITANYSLSDMSGKAACKHALQEELGLEVRDDRPLMVMVTRLTRQKGMDLVTYALDRILSGGVQVAILGTGDYEEPVRYFANKYPGTCAARITFDNALSHRMYAGADLFLMPSLFEPCGLSQMIAMRYGTLPVVRETGGLRDTVQPYNQFTGEGTGFTFANFNGEEMGDAVFRGARLFWDDRAGFDTLVKNAMSSDFSWAKSAHAYIDLFRWLRPDTDAFPSAVEEPKTEAAPKPVVEPVAEAEVKVEAKAEEPKVEAAPEPEAEATVETQPEPKTAEAPKVEPKAKAKQEAEVKLEPEAKPAAKVKPEVKPAAKKRTTTRKSTATKTATSTTKTTASKSTTAAKKTTAKAASTTKAATAKKATASKTTTSATRATAAKKTTAAAKTAPVAKQAPEAASAPAAAKPATEKADATAPAATKTSATKAKTTARRTTRKRS
ncbi:glycogen synthase GlgA [Enorma sp.]|uniref:glycogen synthase GlgA n=1 Tax=Enorma sp. TaxID=1920692 RepID=UPI003AB892A8